MSKQVLDVPDQYLDNLKCSQCQEYLSILPIYSYPEIGIVCGRCPELLDENMLGRRETAYEIVSELLQFPCRYHRKGCLEQMVPSKLKDHEYSCSYREMFCPVLQLGSCAWQGPSSEVYGHYENMHNPLILKNRTFELDLINRYEDNYMMMFDENLYVVQVKCDQRERKFLCSVRFIGSATDRQKYSYQLKFIAHGTDETIKTMDSKPLEDDRSMTMYPYAATQVNLDDFNTMFVNPTAIFCEVVIVRNTVDEAKCSASHVDEDSEFDRSSLPPDVLNVNESFMRHLECIICQECMKPPIMQCLTGHSICSQCKDKIPNCEICHQNFTVRNYALEEIIKFVPYQCKFIDYGCKFLTTPDKIKQHEDECKFSTYNCPLKDFEDCDWVGALSDAMTHVLGEHEDYAYEMGYLLNITLAAGLENTDCYYVLQYGNNVFKLCYKKTVENGVIDHIFNVKLFGPSTEAVNYMYELDFVKDNNRRFYSKLPCSPYYKNNDDDFENALRLPHDILALFMTDDDIQYKCKVHRV